METHRGIAYDRLTYKPRPHSLGKSVEWKHDSANRLHDELPVPTRWGNQLNGNHLFVDAVVHCTGHRVPTRWGNQLNGNIVNVLGKIGGNSCPHSLGKSVEWGCDLYLILK